MKDHRQGNDLAVLWSIFKDGEPFDLRGRSLKLYLKNLHERKEVVDFSVTGNEIHWTFYGKDQDTLGKHSLILVANEDEKGMITTDACDFVRLVSCSCKLQGGEDSPNVETETIELTSTLEYVAGGGSYDDTALWKELEKKVDKEEGLGLSEENYTTEEKEKLAGLENYDDSVIKEELANKADKSEIPTKMSQLEQDIEIGSDYDDTELREAIALRNVGAEDTDESVEEPSIPSNGMSTPSGDPMHYMFEAAGATYNATDADIPMEGVYGDSYVHKAKHWHLNELGDISNEEMREIYLFANMDNSVKNCAQLMQGITTRTNIATWRGVWSNKIQDSQLFGYAYELVTAILRNADTHYTNSNMSYIFTSCKGLEKVFPIIDAANTTSFNGAFEDCKNLREVRIKNAKVAIKFDKSPLISKASILYLIQNSAATSAMVITLHADAYARLAEDADIVAALAEKEFVSLASA